MKAYFIANFTITHPEKYQEYRAKTISTLKPYFETGKAKIIVAASGDSLGIKEGVPSDYVIIIEFESLDFAEEWYNSDEYKPLIKERQAFTKDYWVTITSQFSPQN